MFPNEWRNLSYIDRCCYGNTRPMPAIRILSDYLQVPLRAFMPDQDATSQLRHTQCVCAAARRASRAVTQLYDLVLAPTGIKATQFITLREIADAGELAQWQFAHGYAIATETLSRRLGMARQKGLVQVRRGAKRGERVYSLTVEGRKCLEHATPYWERAQLRMAKALGIPNVADLEDVVAYLAQITDAAQRAGEIRSCNPNRHGSDRGKSKPKVA